MARKPILCGRCGEVTRARHTCSTCKRLCCEYCCVRVGEWYDGATWYECIDSSRCAGRDKRPSEYQFKPVPLSKEEQRAELERVWGKLPAAALRRFNARFEKTYAAECENVALHNAMVTANLAKEAQAKR